MEPPPQTGAEKVRLMCSYGGHIAPLPHKKSLFYYGGDTRIITVPASSTASLFAFSSNISAALHISIPFNLKYQLPLHDLDSLISISSDDDLQIFLEEFHRLSSSPVPTRIRLFLFYAKQPLGVFTTQPELTMTTATTTQCGLTHPKTESWFVDALKGVKMMQKGEMMGFCGDGQNDGLCGHESMMLETTSSFGSSVSSFSLSNLPPIKACGDENVSASLENRTKLPSADSTASDISNVVSAISHGQTGSYQDSTIHVAATENNKASLNPFESSDVSVTELQTPKTVQVSGYPLSSQIDQLRQQQEVQFVPMGIHFVPQSPAGSLPVASYYPVYHTPSHQPQLQYLPNQACPVYVLPVGKTPIYDSSPQYGPKDTLPVLTGRPPLHPNSSLISSPVTYKEFTPAPPIPEFVSQAYRTTPIANSVDKEQTVAVPQIHNQPQLLDVAPQATANYGNQHEDDPVRAQIYKSQPSPPILPSQYQTMTQATTVLLSEALAQLHMDGIKQVRASQPQ